jgi:RimJ/RimL family protein N-acetyltransferase
MRALFDRACQTGLTPLLPDGHPLPDLPEDVLRELAADADVRMLIAEDGERLLAFTTFGPNRDEDSGPGVAEIRMFFADPDAWGAGAAPRLMTEALPLMAELGYGEVTLWSFAANDRANAFYERHGLRRDGAERTQEVWGDRSQVRYRRSLVFRNTHVFLTA